MKLNKSHSKWLLAQVPQVVKSDGFLWTTGIALPIVIGSIISWSFWGELHGSGDSASTTVRNLGLLIGGAIAIPIAIWRSIVATRQVTTAQQGLLNERYQKAAEMLGNENIFVRLGGVYALQALIEEHAEQYYVSCMRLLCAFVRNPPQDENLTVLSDRELTRWGGGPRLRADVQAVIDMMQSRNDDLVALEKNSGFVVDFRGADLRGSNLVFVNFSHVDLRDADLSGAYAVGSNLSHVGLSGARLYKTILASANLSGTDFSGADISRTWFCGRSIAPGIRFGSPAVGIDFHRLQRARARKRNPPILGGVVLDSRSNTPLKWDPSRGIGIEYVSE